MEGSNYSREMIILIFRGGGTFDGWLIFEEIQ